MASFKESILRFQYQYSHFFVLGLNRKKFEMTSTADKFYAMNTSKNTFVALLLTLFSCALFFTGFIEAFINKAEINTEFIIVFWIIHPVFGAIGLRQFLWLINGRQELRIENGELTLMKRGTFFTRPKTFSLASITNVRQTVDEDSLSLFDKILNTYSLYRRILFGHIIGQVLFDYNGETINVFNDMNENDKAKLVNGIMHFK
jgi:hypothetical protein